MFYSLVLFLGLGLVSAEEEPGKDPVGNPSLSVLKNQRVLVVTAMGHPSKAGDKALKLLFRKFFEGATEAEKNAPIAPRVRWVVTTTDTGRKDWIGRYALPVSADFVAPRKGEVVVEEWHYGLCAELLHVGDYASEAASLEILKGYIARNGFTIAGDFEEEFLQGRGALVETFTAEARTLLRYPIESIRDFPVNAMPLTSNP
jgi:hypothetical protein